MMAPVLKSAVILLSAALVATLLLRKQSAALRHAVWTAGLLAALAMPLFAITLPAWPLRTVGDAAAMAGSFFEGAVLPFVASESPATGVSPIPVDTAAPRTSRQLAFALWVIGAAAGLLLMICGAAKLAWVAFRAEPLTDPRWNTIAAEVRQALGLRRRVHLLQNSSVRFLGTWGVSSPRILLPADAGTWSEERIRFVLAHEMAHIKRNDWPVQVLAEAARAIYWFNPLFWLACTHLRQESEHACDDTVVRLGVPGTRYAEELLDLTRALRNSPAVRSPMLAMAQPSHLERRLVALLNPTLNRLAATPWTVLVVAAAAVVLTLPLAALRSGDTEETAAPAELSAAPVAEASIPSSPLPDPDPLEESESVMLPARTESARALLKPPAPETPLSSAAASALASEVPDSSRETCAVTPTLRRKQVQLEKTAALGSGPWHINDNQTIWAWDQPYTAGKEINSMWIRPPDNDLVIRARHTDSEAVFETTIPSKYPTSYVSAALVFPFPGCWEVRGTVGDDTLTFITWVETR